MHGYSITVYRHDIEANSGSGGKDLGIVGGDPAHPPALPGIYRCYCRTEAPPLSEFDLDEDQGLSVEANEVDFAARQAQIPG